MKHKSTRALYAYWNALRGPRLAPRRFEIEPARLAAILPDTFILDCSTAGASHFRLAGTRLSALFDRDLRASAFEDLFRPVDRTTVRNLIGQVVDQGPVCVIESDRMLPDDPGGQLEVVLLPLVHTHRQITRILGCAVTPDLPETSDREPLSDLTLRRHDIVWPDGRPHVVLDQMGVQNPFSPEHALAQIVTANRRRFRVYDGGRSS